MSDDEIVTEIRQAVCPHDDMEEAEYPPGSYQAGASVARCASCGKVGD